MFAKIADFVEEWTLEAELTAQAMDRLTDASLKQPVAEGRRTLGQIAWHIAVSPHYMTSLGLDFAGPEREGAPASAAAIAAECRRLSEALLQAVRTQWTDASLAETLEMNGKTWSKGGALRFTIMHQAHHRGQMTVLMRQAGLRVPEIYGQTYESWIEQGVTPLP